MGVKITREEMGARWKRTFQVRSYQPSVLPKLRQVPVGGTGPSGGALWNEEHSPVGATHGSSSGGHLATSAHIYQPSAGNVSPYGFETVARKTDAEQFKTAAGIPSNSSPPKNRVPLVPFTSRTEDVAFPIPLRN